MFFMSILTYQESPMQNIRKINVANHISRTIQVLLIPVLLVLTACSDQREAFSTLTSQMGNIWELKQHIDKTLTQGTSGINIQNSSSLTVSLVNTELNKKNTAERSLKADEILSEINQFIQTHQTLTEVQYVTIVFVHYEKKYFIVDYSETIDYYQFQREQTR